MPRRNRQRPRPRNKKAEWDLHTTLDSCYLLPRVIPLPFGYRIKVKQITTAEMREKCKEPDGKGGLKQGDLADGFWDVDAKTIFIRRCLPMKRKRYILIHELKHAVNDYQHEMLDRGIAKN